jgi:hypothetical protein
MGWASRLRKQAERARRAPAAANAPADTTRKPAEVVARPADPAKAFILDHLQSIQQGTRDQLAILRQTRGQRDVGSVKIPAHLIAPVMVKIAGDSTDPQERERVRLDPNAVNGVEVRGDILPGGH